MKLLLRRIILRLTFAVETFFWFVQVCPECPPIQRMNMAGLVAVCPSCGKRISR